MAKIEAVIFDMDGTLVDSREVVLGAFKHVMEEMGVHYDEKIVSSHVGRLLEHQYEALLPGYDVKKLTELHRSWQADNKHLLKGYDGLADFLVQLRGRGLKLAIFTSAVRSRADLALDGLGVHGYFEVIIGGDEIKNPKPHAEGVLTILDRLGISIEQAVMVGDAEHDILSGKNAGVVTIGITHGFGTREALEAAGADYIVSNLQELDKLLAQLATIK